MLEFIIGRSGSGKTEQSLKEIVMAVEQDPLGKPIVFLTPAHLTYKIERKLAGMLEKNGKGFMRVQVYSFARLARQVLLETGGGIYPRLSVIGKRLLLKKVSARRAKELKVFSKAVKRRGFSADLADCVKELKGFGISPEYLGEKSAALADGQLKEKVQDLAILYRDFSVQMAGTYNDAEDVLDALIKHIPDSGYLQGAEVWLDGFAYFNPQERAIITELLKTAARVHVSLQMDVYDDAANSADTGLFHDAWEIEKILTEIAVREKHEVQRRMMPDLYRYKAEGIATIERDLFRPVPQKGECSGVKIIEAANRRRELDAVAVDIVKLCRESNYHWNEIGVLFRNPEDYGNLPSMVFNDYGIPFFCDFKREGVQHPLAELIRSAFDILQRWQYEPIFRALKTGFFSIIPDQIDLLENYVLRFGIKDDRWLQSENWNWIKRYDELETTETELTEQQKEELLAVDMIRRRITEPLQMFAEEMKNSGNVKDMTMAVYNFLNKMEVPQKLLEWSEKAQSEGRLADAAMHRQIWDDVVDLLEQFVTMSGEEKLSHKDYAAIFSEGLEALNVALIPPGHDYVSISSFDRNSLAGVRALYIVGANEGVMPRRCQESGLFSDAERLHLAEHDIKLAGGSRRESFSEANVLYRGFVTGSDYLWISYPLADTDGKGLKPSVYIAKLKEKIMPEAEQLYIGIEEAENKIDPLSAVANKRQAVTALSAVLRDYGDKVNELGFWQDIYNYLSADKEMATLFSLVIRGLNSNSLAEKLPEKLAEQLYGRNNRLKASISRFESFRDCPFKHFLEHGMKLKEREKYQFQIREHGTFLHAVMAQFGEDLKNEGKKWSEISSDDCHKRCSEIVEKLAPRMMGEILYSSEQKNNLRERIQRTAEKSLNRLIEFDKISKFSPAEFERSFGLGEGDASPLRLNLQNGFVLEIRGKIDRIDRSDDGKYYLIIDYKTGQMEINLTDVFYGVKMQLLTYLLLARSIAADDAVPAGVLYCFLRNKTITDDCRLSETAVKERINKELRMPGWLLADEDIVKMVDETAKFIKVKLKAKGGIESNSLSGVKTKDEFGILLKYMEWMLKDTGNKILAGEINIRPYKGKEKACKYCHYQAVCRFDRLRSADMINKPQKYADAEIFKLMQEKGEE